MKTAIAIVVFACLPSAPFDAFDPHRVNAVEHFVEQHSDVCWAEAPEPIEGPSTVEECNRGALFFFMPGWIPRHPDRVYLGARCVARPSGPSHDDFRPKVIP
ncbi:hypothetical protein [Methyloceanibacter caenitepidi]|uniref:Uncharacterized protein n=1 Tax=Methyloceanibacter caenitepidi TaxID=1384459 RepID=A0A0A8K1T1_9HYPH|nr:hypothetical protein [Methyloceanibacter caenitepidi]BAQ16898.1 hypothetical protein GL4_1442 [Methyloceanibacter caenitepidi]